MASAVAKRSNHRATRSASWSVMHSDEELARILQMQEEKEYQDHLAAKEVQCQSDHQLARLLSKHDGHLPGGMNLDEFQDARHPTTRPPTTGINASNSNGPPPRSSSQNATAISVTDSDTDFSDCFEDTTFDDELSTALERDRTVADSLAERQDAADALIRNDEIAEALQNDEQLNRMGENELSWSMGEPGNASYNPLVVSPESAASGISISRLDLSNFGNEPMELSRVFVDEGNDDDWASANESAFSPESASANNSLLTSVNIAWNAVGSAVNWVSELFSGGQPPVQSGVGNRVTVHPAGDAEEEEDDEDEEEGCEEDDDDDGWEDEDSDDLGDLDDGDDIDDDEVAAFDMIDSDMDDDSDDENVDPLAVFRVNAVPGRGRGLVPSEIDVLPTRTFQSRPPQTATSGAADAAGASENQRQNECQVCLSSFADGEVLRTLPCCHLFHSECIDVWLQRNAICPVCRVRIRDEIGCR